MTIRSNVSLGLTIRLLDIRITALSAERLARRDLTPADIAVLGVIGAQPGMRASAVAHALMIKAPNLTKLVNRLTDRGLVKREVSSDDERAIALTLTPKGQRAVAFGREVAGKVEDIVLRNQPPADRAHLMAMLLDALQSARNDVAPGDHAEVPSLAASGP